MEPQTSNISVISLLQDLGVSSIYLMGFSFILGSLFTMFLLVVLEMTRRNNQPPEEK